MKKDVFTKFLAILGAVLVGLPLAMPVFFALVRLAQAGEFNFDFLIPAELFSAELAGGLLLLWAALRAHARRAWIGWSLGASVGLFFAGQVFAVVTGLASGETEPVGILIAAGIAFIAAFWIALVSLAAGGIVLARDLFRSG